MLAFLYPRYSTMEKEKEKELYLLDYRSIL